MVRYTTVLFLFISIVSFAICAKLKFCMVDGRGGFRKAEKYCPLLNTKDSDVECVIATDRLDCLRRILKGKVDFSVFNAEDLVTAANSDIPILLTNELKFTDDDSQYKMVAVVSNDSGIKSKHDLKDKKLCHPGYESEVDSNRIISNYLEASTVLQECNPALTLSENRISASSHFFKAACKAGPWVHDLNLDRDLKLKYKNLCALCDVPSSCSLNDKYWGRRGPLYCLTDGVGDVAWARLDDTRSHFGMVSGPNASSPDGYSYLCPNGYTIPLNSTNPCIWVVKPWPVVASVRNQAERVQDLVSSLKYDKVTSWKKALLSLIEFYHVTIKKMEPIEGIESFFDRSTGFLSANSFTGCHPPRTIKMCTTNNLEYAKCGWLREAAAVYGIEPDVDCVKADNTTHCMMALNDSYVDIVMVPPSLLHKAKEDYKFQTVFYETVADVDKYLTVAVVKKNSTIQQIADLKDRTACFPEYDGIAWNTMINELVFNKLINRCYKDGFEEYFGEICVNDDYNGDKLNKTCQSEKYRGDFGALRCLNDDIGEVAFVSRNNFEKFQTNATNNGSEYRVLCVKGDDKFCHLSWSAAGQGMTSKNKTSLWIKDALDVFLQFDNLFGNVYKSPTKSFSLFGSFDGNANVLFHDSTVKLRSIPKSKNMDDMPRYYEEILRAVDTLYCPISSSTSTAKTKFTLFTSFCTALLVLCSFSL